MIEEIVAVNASIISIIKNGLIRFFHTDGIAALFLLAL